MKLKLEKYSNYVCSGNYGFLLGKKLNENDGHCGNIIGDSGSVVQNKNIN